MDAGDHSKVVQPIPTYSVWAAIPSALYVSLTADEYLLDAMDWTLVKEVIRKHDGVARDVTLRQE